MKIYTTIQLGQFHPIFCEDFLFYQQIHPHWFIGGVFDGCSSGLDSHFAASLFGKCLKMICKQLPYQELLQKNFDLNTILSDQLGNFILKELFQQIQKHKNLLHLETVELLATAVILVYNIPQQQAWVNISGDGVISAQGVITTLDQNDRPNYLAYHLFKNYLDWLSQETVTYQFDNVRDLAISTDGVLSFAKNTVEDIEGFSPIDYLLIDNSFHQQVNMLNRKCIELYKEHQLLPNDDVGIIRLIN